MQATYTHAPHTPIAAAFPLETGGENQMIQRNAKMQNLIPQKTQKVDHQINGEEAWSRQAARTLLVRWQA
jgi:hypothetical protein